MATYENVGLITYKDKNGDLQRLYPITRKACIEGMDYIDAHITATGNTHGMTTDDIGAVPTSRKINNKELSGDITLTAADVGASTVAVDSTLAKTGYAADAKKTGDSISALSTRVDGVESTVPKFAVYDGILSSTGWVGDSAPYTQSITQTGITDDCHVSSYPNYPGTQDEDLSMMEACAAISYAKHEGNNVTFVCLSDKPTSDVYIRLEVRV